MKISMWTSMGEWRIQPWYRMIGFLVIVGIGLCAGQYAMGQPAMGQRVRPQPPVGKPIYVTLLVDEEEPYVRSVWQEKLQRRLNQASDILASYCDVRFVPAGYGTWISNNHELDLRKSLREFEKKVSVAPRHLAIGFTSQYRFQRGRHTLGGTRGPLRSHILIREYAPSVQEAAKLEVLVHELGHYLGAIHSTSPSSVMRPVLADGKMAHRSFQITFDGPNARIVRLVSREVANRRIQRFSQLSPATVKKMHREYQTLLQLAPDDPLTRKYVSAFERFMKHQATAGNP